MMKSNKSGSYNIRDAEASIRTSSSGQISVKRNPSDLQCVIRHLDNDEKTVYVSKNATGRELLQEFFKVIDPIVETDYFGLYIPKSDPVHWIAEMEPLKKQVPKTRPIVLEFGVKFFVSNPNKLVTDYARYLMFLQLREDLATGRFVCPPGVAMRLCAYAVQADLGDFKETEHHIGYLSDMLLLPEQTDVQEAEISRIHKELCAMTSSEAEQAYMALAAQQELYGVDLHAARTGSGDQVHLGVCAMGIKLYDKHLRLVDTYRWGTIQNIQFDGKKFVITNKPRESFMGATKAEFKCSTKEHARILWGSAVQRHTFFRRKKQPKVNPVSPVKMVLGIAAESPLRKAQVGSRTELEIAQNARKQTNLSSSDSFYRAPPQRRSSMRVRSGSTSSANKYIKSSIGSRPRSMSSLPTSGDSAELDEWDNYSLSTHSVSTTLDFGTFTPNKSEASMTKRRSAFDSDILDLASSMKSTLPAADEGTAISMEAVGKRGGEHINGDTDAGHLENSRLEETRLGDTSMPGQSRTPLFRPAALREKELEKEREKEREKEGAPRFFVPPPPPVVPAEHSSSSIIPKDSVVREREVPEAMINSFVQVKRMQDEDEEETDNSSRPKLEVVEAAPIIIKRASSVKVAKDGTVAPIVASKQPEVEAEPEEALQSKSLLKTYRAASPSQSNESEPELEPELKQLDVSAEVAVAKFEVAVESRRTSESSLLLRPADISESRKASQISVSKAPLAVVGSETPPPSRPRAAFGDQVGVGSTVSLTSSLAVGAATTNFQPFFVCARMDWNGAQQSKLNSDKKILSLAMHEVYKVVSPSPPGSSWLKVENVKTKEAGFIPSGFDLSVFPEQVRRLAATINTSDQTIEDPAKSGRNLQKRSTMTNLARSLFGHRKREVDVVGGAPSEDDNAFGVIYDIVELRQADKENIRPVIILGPSKDQAIDRLVMEFPDNFHTCVPHTTRRMREDEADGLDYHFVSLQDMERDVAQGKFIETVRFQGNLYGTSFDSIRSAAQPGSHCLLDISDPKTIQTLKAADMHPIALFLRPSNINSILDQNPGYTMDAARGLLDLSRVLEDQYRYEFTAIIENDRFDKTFQKLHATIMSVASKPFWSVVSGESRSSAALPNGNPGAGKAAGSKPTEIETTQEVPRQRLSPQKEKEKEKESDLPADGAEGNGFGRQASNGSIKRLTRNRSGRKSFVGVEIIKFAKGPGGLGFSFAGGIDSEYVEGDTSIYVTKIAAGGSAEQDGRLQVGDKILAANDHSFVNISHGTAISILKTNPNGVKLKVARKCRRIKLIAENGRYGLGIRGGIDSKSPVIVSRIQPESPAAKHPRLSVGHEITHVNGIHLRDKTHAQVLDLIKASQETLELIVHPRKHRSRGREDGDKQNANPGDELEYQEELAEQDEINTNVDINSVAVDGAEGEGADDLPGMNRRDSTRKSFSKRGSRDDGLEGNSAAATVNGTAANGGSSTNPFDGLDSNPFEGQLISPIQQAVDESSNKKLVGGSFKAVPVFRRGFVRERTCSDALTPVNMPKNRYKDILPYNDTRVKLRNAESDYINANHVTYDTGDAVFEYIACQGPKENTASHFWEMVEENKVEVICMLTTLVEGGRVKCHQYWPDSFGTPVDFGGYLVTLTSETNRGDFFIRKMTLQRKGSREIRTVHHLQFTGWPDHGVPASHEGILQYVEEVQKLKSKQVRTLPLLVHCSAGIGRTGVYIMLELGLATFQENKPVDMPSMLRRLREQRMGMVQTEPQYHFCYTTLAKVRREEGPDFKIVP